jgi:hypothetical protein
MRAANVIKSLILASTVVVSAGAFAAGKADGPAPVAEGTKVNAVWVESDRSLTYMGFTSHYSCDGLEGKVRSILRDLGARPDFKVTSSGCVNLNGPEVMPRVRIRAALPQEATPDVLAALAKPPAGTKQSGKKSTAAADAAKPFPATWRTVQFRDTGLSDLQDGDCELMDQLIKEVLVPMGVREVPGSSVHCVPHQLTLGAVTVQLRVLQPDVPAERPAGK